MADPWEEAAKQFRAQGGGASSTPASTPATAPTDGNDWKLWQATNTQGTGEKPSLGGFVSNLGSSAMNYGAGLVGAVTSPIETAKNVANLGVGTLANMAGPRVAQTVPQQAQLASDVGQYYKQRAQHPIQTLYQDPVGALGDVSMLASGAGAAADVARLPGLARIASTASEFTNPVSLAGKMATAAIPDRARLASAMYKGSLTFPQDMSLPERRAAVAKGLELRAPVSESSIRPLEEDPATGQRIPGTGGAIPNYINDRMRVVESAIQNAIQQGRGFVTSDEILKPIDDLIAQQYTPAGKLLGPDAVDAALKVRNDIINPATTTPAGRMIAQSRANWQLINRAATLGGDYYQIPLDDAQLMKQRSYDVLRNAYGEEKSPGLEAKKAGVRGTRQAVETQAPEVVEPNQDVKSAIDLSDAIERKMKQSPQWLHDITPYLIAGGVTSGILGHEGMAGASIGAALIREAIRSPQVMSRLAVALSWNPPQMVSSLARPVLRAIPQTINIGARLGQPPQPAQIDLSQSPALQ